LAQKTPITVAHGDGIGPEIMSATLRILEAAGAQLELETIEIGESVYKRGFTSGIEPAAWDSLRRTKVFLKAPITTPQGGGYKSLNVTIRKTLGLYANVRPAVSYHPFVATKHPRMDLVIIRENEEDLYAGIEHRQTGQVVQCLKLITRPGSEKIVRYAFEYARQNNRRKVTCFSKDNIMKLTDGLFHKVFNEIGAQYPDIEKEHWIVDIGAARLADTPEIFDVIVTPNLYGDILSDVAAQLTGSVGLAGSANIGEHVAMFEAIHGSAPQIAGQGIANPSGLLLGAVMMLVHIGQPEVAAKVHNAFLCVLEDGIHTPDIYSESVSKQKVNTAQFTDALIARLGQQPKHFKPVAYRAPTTPAAAAQWTPPPPEVKKMVGVDVFLDWRTGSPDELAAKLQPITNGHLQLAMITNRGVKVWPQGMPETFCTDHWRARFLAKEGAEATHQEVIALLQRVASAGLDFIKTENLYTFNGEPGFSLGQGQ
jgi:isocitrate dehydrogenase